VLKQACLTGQVQDDVLKQACLTARQVQDDALGIKAESPAQRGFWKKPCDDGLQRKARPPFGGNALRKGGAKNTIVFDKKVYI